MAGIFNGEDLGERFLVSEQVQGEEFAPGFQKGLGPEVEELAEAWLRVITQAMSVGRADQKTVKTASRAC